MSKILSEINELDQKDKYTLLQDFIFLANHLEFIFGMPEPWFIILDNQILNDLKYQDKNKYNVDNRKRYIRSVAVLMLFHFLENYTEIDIAVTMTPCLFYEFNNRNIIADKQSFCDLLDACSSLFKKFKVEQLASFGLDNYKIASRNIKNIVHDEKQIIKVIQKLKKRQMAFDVYQKFSLNNENNKKSKVELFKPPYLIAFQIAKKQRINLKYFNRDVINRVVACHLEKEVYSDSVNTNLLKMKIKNFRHDTINKTASMTNIKKGELKGIADIELIQYCNISIQFDYGLEYTIYPLTFDKKLADIIQETTGFNASMTISGEDSKEDINTKQKIFTENQKRMDIIEERGKKIFGQLSCFYEDLSPLFIS